MFKWDDPQLSGTFDKDLFFQSASAKYSYYKDSNPGLSHKELI